MVDSENIPKRRWFLLSSFFIQLASLVFFNLYYILVLDPYVAPWFTRGTALQEAHYHKQMIDLLPFNLVSFLSIILQIIFWVMIINDG